MVGMTCERFDFAFAPAYTLPGAVFGVRPATAWVDVRDSELHARYGQYGGYNLPGAAARHN